MLREERALFAQREACSAQPSRALDAALRAQLTREVADATVASARPSVVAARLGPARRGATRLVRRGGSAVASLLRRGHASAACAAALFAFVAFSKLAHLGGAPLLPGDEASAGASEDRGPRLSSLVKTSHADEPLACTEAAQPLALSSMNGSRAGATTQFMSTFSASHDEDLACDVGSGGGKAWCESCGDVTCSSVRQ